MDDQLLMMEDERHIGDREYRRLDRYRRDAEEEEEEEEESTTSAAADAVGGRKRGEESSVMMRWEKFLPMMAKGKGKEKGDGFLRVLLVEGDDCTRQIIAALLRTCSYKVTAFSDGLKAWEMLKERPQSIDVVLAEVDVSSISGISLLSMIMDHESCKNIPVIMMSSDDSINMVYKCMLKGAADFLVKPIRKNELRNLWQHVWRRHISGDGSGSTKVSQDDNTEEKTETKPLNDNQKYESSFPVKNNKDCSEKGSDAESSCTRSDMEVESTYKQNLVESPQATCKSFSHLSGTMRPEEINQPNGSLGHECEHEGESAMLGSECMPVNEELLDEDRPCALAETANEDVKPTGSICNNSIPSDTEDQACDEVVPPRQIIDLIGTIDNQRQFGYGVKENAAEDSNLHDASEIVFHDEGFSFKASAPSLELSLRRHLHRSVGTEEKNERSMLNHSDSSAFSLYNSRTKMSPLLRTVNLQSEDEECYSPTSKQIPDRDFSTSSSVPRCHGTVQHGNTEEAESLNFGASCQNGIAIKCSPIRGVPLPIPVGGLKFERSVGHHPPMQPTFYPESSGLLWSSSPSEKPGAIRMDASYQAETIDCYTSHQHLHNQPSERPVLYSEQPEYRKVNTDEPWHVDTPMPGDSAGSHMCHGDSVRSMDGNGHRRILNEGDCSGNTSTTRVSHVTSQNEEEKKQADLYRLHQREAALNKFRLKRKDRCFEKKVRYQSRKRLAEQRPRVKGQFVRHIQPVACSTEAGTCQVEQAVG